MISFLSVVSVLVSGVIDMVAFGSTPIIVGATSYRFDNVIDRQCNSAKDVGIVVIIDNLMVLLLQRHYFACPFSKLVDVLINSFLIVLNL